MANIIHKIQTGSQVHTLGTIHYIEGTGTTAGTWLGSDPSITEYYNGLTIAYKVGVAGASTTTLNINNLGAIQVRRNATTKVTTIYGVSSIILLTYTTDDEVGYWKCYDYDSDTKARSSNTSSKIFLIGATTQSTSGQTTYSHDTAYVGTDGCLYSNSKKVSVIGHTHTVEVPNSAAFSGTTATLTTTNATNSTVASSTHTHTTTSAGSYTPAGSVSQPTFTGSAVTSGGASATETIYQITGVGTAASHSYTAPSLSAAIANKCMTFTWSAGSHSFTANTVPTRASIVVAKAHTHSVTASGSVSKPTFSGTAATISVSGTSGGPSATVSVAAASHNHSVTHTPAGSVSLTTETKTTSGATT